MMLRSMCGTTDTPSAHALPELCLSAFAEPIDLLDFDLLLEPFSSESQFALCIRQLKCSFSSSWAPVSWSFSLSTLHNSSFLNLLYFPYTLLSYTRRGWCRETRKVFRNKRVLAHDMLQRPLPPLRRVNGTLRRRRLLQ